MKKLLLASTAVIGLTVAHSQDTIISSDNSQPDTIPTVQLVRGSRIISISQFNSDNLFYEKLINSTGEIWNEYRGQALKIENDSLILRPNKLNQDILYKSGGYKTTSQWLKNNVPHISISLKDIEKISICHKTTEAISGLVWGLSVVSAVAVAPLVSIKYKNGGFNKDRYATVAGISIATFATALTIQLTLSHKTYYTKTKGNKKVWSLKYGQ